MDVIHIPGDPTALDISYHMAHTTCASRHASGFLEAEHYKVPGHDIAYAIRPGQSGEPDSLWITGTEIQFIAKIKNNGATGQLAGWKAGFIQSIYVLKRNGHYETGVERRLRLDNSFGALTDGHDPPFYASPAKFGPGQDKVALEASDAPNFRLPLEYGPQRSRLSATSGGEVFCTFLALARESDKTIIELARLEWHINWAGVYKPNSWQPWKPSDAGEFLRVRLFDCNRKVHPQLATNHKHVPFSLKMTQAERFCQIRENGTWTRCTMGGNVADPEPGNLDTWRTHVSST